MEDSIASNRDYILHGRCSGSEAAASDGELLKAEVPADPNKAESARPYSLASLIEMATADAEKRFIARAEGQPLGPIFPISVINHHIGDCLAPGFHTLHGSPGSGKTTLALQTACCCQFPSLFVTTEMPPVELLRRISSRVTRIPFSQFKSGEMDPEDCRRAFILGAQSAPNLVILDATTAPAEPKDVHRHARRLFRAAGSQHYLVVIDSVHTFARRYLPGYTEYDALDAAISALQQVALGTPDSPDISERTPIPVLGIAERNRSSMKDGGKSASAGHRLFEYAPETVIGMDVVDKTCDPNGMREILISIEKNRHGDTREFRVKFKGPIGEFTI